MAMNDFNSLLDYHVLKFLTDHGFSTTAQDQIFGLEYMIDHWRSCPSCSKIDGMHEVADAGEERLAELRAAFALMN